MKVYLIFFLTLTNFMAFAQKTALDKYFTALDPEIGVSMQLSDLEGNTLYHKNDTVQVAAASTIKIPILIEYFFQKEQKRLKSRDKIKLTEELKVGGSGDLQYEAPHKEYTLDFLAKEMIRISDNTATNILIDKIGEENINGMLKHHGFIKTVLRRKMMDFEAVLNGRDNTTSAAEMNEMLLMLSRGGLLSLKSQRKVIALLKECEDYTTFPAQLVGVPIAHKSGTLDNLRADVGIIYGKRPFILSVFVQNFESLFQAEKIIADIAAICHQEMNDENSLDLK